METSFWHDLRIGDSPLKISCPRLFRISSSPTAMVNQFGFWDSSEWKWSFVWSRSLWPQDRWTRAEYSPLHATSCLPLFIWCWYSYLGSKQIWYLLGEVRLNGASENQFPSWHRLHLKIMEGFGSSQDWNLHLACVTWKNKLQGQTCKNWDNPNIWNSMCALLSISRRCQSHFLALFFLSQNLGMVVAVMEHGMGIFLQHSACLREVAIATSWPFHQEMWDALIKSSAVLSKYKISFSWG